MTLNKERIEEVKDYIMLYLPETLECFDIDCISDFLCENTEYTREEIEVAIEELKEEYNFTDDELAVVAADHPPETALDRESLDTIVKLAKRIDQNHPLYERVLNLEAEYLSQALKEFEKEVKADLKRNYDLSDIEENPFDKIEIESRISDSPTFDAYYLDVIVRIPEELKDEVHHLINNISHYPYEILETFEDSDEYVIEVYKVIERE